ncbi:formate dehydrogenase subunit alpha [Halegenticoccus soli]|uniref:formate dehydrogenase subunit alpha n=1 Tax=Halegenticoccus soli TaxID=1985678 RepID=UPI000C6EF662|nr:formate dehydrogenase subunit alpha [Halegenticoccus soli]
MSTEDTTPDANDGADSAPGSLPRVPAVENPRHETPLTENFTPGTANDPPVEAGIGAGGGDGAGAGTAEMVTLTVDGRTVAVRSGTTILDALVAADATDGVPALCYYDRAYEDSKGESASAADEIREDESATAADEIGPRSECRTCVVETEEHGVVPSCSHPVEDGMTVRTDADAAAEARDVNLDLVLSNHNLRCTTCGKNGRCELQDAAIENDVTHPRYGVLDDRDAYEPLDATSPFIQIDRNKCILCNRCVEACNDVQVEGVLRIEGSGPDTRIGFQSEAETMADSECVSCGHCATVCPTGSLVETGLADATTLPIPGFNQKNSVGKVIEASEARNGGPSRGLGGEKEETRRATRDGVDDLGVGRADAETSGVARFMARARRRAREAATEAGKRAFLAGEHAAEGIAAKTMPEGVLFDVAKGVGDYRLGRIEKTETTCGYCAVGCRFELYSTDDEVLGVRPTDAASAPMNDFSTCVKGKFGYEFVSHEGRLTTPLVRDEGDGEFREATWDEALDRVVEGLTAVRDEVGPDAVACFASSKCTNEDNYLMQKFARTALGTKNIDNCARLCHSSTVAALLQTVGYGAMSNSGDDVANADCYLITGSNTTESHPVLATRIKRNVRDGADLVVFDPRKVGIAEHADQYVRTKPGFDVAWINGMIRHVVENDLHDAEFVEERTKHFDELVEKVEPFTPEEVERLTGVAPDDLVRAAETIAAADSCVFGWAMGMTQHSHGTQNVLALANLALVTGNVGEPNAGLSPFRGHNNVQGGGGDMGTLPNKLPGYQDVTDPDVLDAFERGWGVRPPEEVGLKVPETFVEALAGNLKAMYVMGENPALSEPDITHAEEALEALDFLVVQDVFMTETAEYADVVLPAATFAEKDGTFTNTERRVQLVQKALEPPGEARQDWEILQALARRMGRDWDYDSPAAIMDEISTIAPIYGGISHDRLREEGGLQWPCPDEDHPGTRFLYEDEFNFPDGRARFVPADMGEPGELPDEEYPLTLTTGRVLYHWHTGTLTRRMEGMLSHVGESFVEIHPATADRLGVEDGGYVSVESKRGSITAKAQVTERPGEGVVFIPMHFAEGAVNTLTQEDAFDPTSGIPEYKVASVRVTPAGSDPGADAGSRATGDD